MRNKIESASAFTLLSLAIVIFLLSTGSSAASQEQPTVAKDSVQATAFTFNVYRGSYDTWSWVPKLEYRVNGPISSGGQLYAEFTIPGGAALKFDCPTEETQAGRWWKTECGGRKVPEDKGSTYTGGVQFAIKLRNELAGTDATLFTGRMKVVKARPGGPVVPNHFVYYVDQDWKLPIGYVYLTPNDLKGWERPNFHVAFWTRGAYNGSFQPHLFYQGKEVSKKFFEGREVGKPVCDPEAENGTTLTVADTVPQKATWVRVRCTFFNVQGWDKTGEAPGLFGPPYTLNDNPGEYEIKVLWNNRLARSIKFTIGADGKLDERTALANKLGSNRSVVPIQIIGEQDGPWDRAAWKTEAFYGNPLTGFTASP